MLVKGARSWGATVGAAPPRRGAAARGALRSGAPRGGACPYCDGHGQVTMGWPESLIPREEVERYRGEHLGQRRSRR
jgi:hypothetical protein